MRTLARRIIDRELRSFGAYLRAAHAAVDDPAPGTPAREDLDHVNIHPERDNLVGLRWWAHKAVTLNLHAATEHLKGVQRLLAADGELLPLPAMACARSVYEAVINTCWLIDVEVPVEQRMARWSGRLLHDTQEPPNALSSFGDVEAAFREKEKVVEGRSLGQKLMARAGFELKLKGGDKSEETRNVAYRGQVSNLTPKVDDLIPRFTPDQQSLWPLFSAAADGRGWLVEGLDGPIEELYTSILSPLIDTGDALAVETGRYLGLNPREVVTKLHRHRGVLLRRARPNSSPLLGVDGFRARSGTYPLPPRGEVGS